MDWNRLGRTLLIVFLSIVIILLFGFIAWNLGGEKLAFRLGIGEPIKIQRFSSHQWHGQEDYIKHRIEELITISQELGIFDENILPIWLNVRNLYRIRAIAGAHRSRFNSYIIFDNNYLGMTSREDLDSTIVHEFSHLLTFHEKEEHGLEWKKTCQKIFSETRRLYEKETTSTGAWRVWPDPCVG